MTKVTFSVPEISCGHCTSSIDKELNGIAGVITASSDVATKTATVEFDDSVTIPQLIEALDNIGFEAEEI